MCCTHVVSLSLFLLFFLLSLQCTCKTRRLSILQTAMLFLPLFNSLFLPIYLIHMHTKMRTLSIISHGRLRQILKILKDSYNPRLKSVVFDRWFDMFTDSRLMAVAIKFHLRRNSDSVTRFGTQSCSVTTPTMNVKLSPVENCQDKL